MVNQGMIKEREDSLDIMKMVDKNKYPDGKDATYRIKRQVNIFNY